MTKPQKQDPETLVPFRLDLPAGVIATLEAEARRRNGTRPKDLATWLLINFAHEISMARPELSVKYVRPSRPKEQPIDPAILAKIEKGKFLGELCSKSHDHENTGRTLYRSTNSRDGSICVQCAAEYRTEYNKANQAEMKRKRIDIYKHKHWMPLLNRARREAKKLHLEFKLTEEWAFSNVEGFCAVLGIPIRLIPGQKIADGDAVISRIDATIGFYPENCRIISRKAALQLKEAKC